MSKMLSVFAGVSALALAGTASAGGPMSLTNSQMDIVTAGGAQGFNYAKNLQSTSTSNVNFTGRSNINDTLTKEASIDARARVLGNSASLGFDNEAVGKNSSVQGTLSQETVARQGSSQSGLFISAATGHLLTRRN